MLTKGFVRLLLLVALVLITFLWVAQHKRYEFLGPWSMKYGEWAKKLTPPTDTVSDLAQNWDGNDNNNKASVNLEDIGFLPSKTPPQEQKLPDTTGSDTHNEIFSRSTSSGEYFSIVFGEHTAFNPNIIPHPSSDDRWIIVAQRKNKPESHFGVSEEIVCEAAFHAPDKTVDSAEANVSLSCINPPNTLPVAATNSKAAPGQCHGRWEPLNIATGPHDARLFYGPEVPYLMYGSNSQYTCFGQWMHDFRMLFSWVVPNEASPVGVEQAVGSFQTPRELYRPAPYGEIEKNYFVFWDTAGEAYVHYNVWPQRSFAKIETSLPDPSANDSVDNTSAAAVGADLAIFSSMDDAKCIANYMPKISTEARQAIHQATNSLSITLCKRSEPDCQPNDLNTYIFVIFQQKDHLGFFVSYEPYVMLFRRTAPFELHAISTKPFWIHGRKAPPPDSDEKPEMMYVTSMSWKDHSLKYHGYSDDILFLGFGIDDSRTAGIDIQAGDLLRDMGFCSND